MKIIKTLVYVVIIVALVGGVAYLSRSESLKKTMMTFNAEKGTYQMHHQPTPDWYYSVESESVAGDKAFIIGRNMQPVLKNVKGGEVVISLEPNGKLQEIEVPAKKAGLKAGAIFFTVKTVDGIPTLIYFPSEQEVIKSMIRARNTPAGT